MRLIMVRHGETEENRDSITQGQTPGHLTKLGKSQAKKLGERLASDNFDIIYCSDLLRCKDTCAEISKHHPSVPVVYSTGVSALKAEPSSMVVASSSRVAMVE